MSGRGGPVDQDARQRDLRAGGIVAGCSKTADVPRVNGANIDTNKITADTASGTQAITNWTVGHQKVTFPSCTAWIQVKGTSFVSVFAPGKQVFICVQRDIKNPVPVTPPAGTPGA